MKMRMKMTKLDNYEDLVKVTKVYPDSAKYSYATLGLTSEAGEVAGKIKKYFRGDYASIDEIKPQLIDELGDVLWYITALAIELDTTLDHIKQVNQEKLLNRLQKNKIHGEGDNR
jgi:NTP pyrophosphatase (non-canonical NTP hydrolase)